MKKAVLMGLIFLLAFGAGSCARRDGVERLRFATGGVAGTYYPYGTAIAQILTEKTGIPITVQSTGASRANILLIDDGEVEMALAQNDVMYYAWNGIDLFSGQQIRSFRTIAGLYAEVVQIVARAGSGINSIADLRGRVVSVGDAGSGVEFNSRQILGAYGITFNDIIKQNLGFAASAEALRDGRIDAFFCVAGAPTPAIVDLATTRDIIILEIDDVHAAKLMERYSFYTHYPVPAGTYRGVGRVQTLSVKATLLVSSHLSEDTVYRLTRALFENQEAIAIAHVRGRDLSPHYAVERITVPLHPGAERYFREISVLR